MQSQAFADKGVPFTHGLDRQRQFPGRCTLGNDGARAIVAKSASARELPLAIKAVCEGHTFVSECLRLQLEEAGVGDQQGMPQLSGKEREVVRMLASGMTVSQIAARVNRSISTISKQKSTAMSRLCISTDVDLFAYARSSGMVP